MALLDLSKKQKEVLVGANARLNFLIGAVRSGKTYVSLIRWLKYVINAPEGSLIMVGRTSHTIKRNIIDEILDLVGADARYFVGKGELHLWGKKIYLVSCSDARAEGKIRGMTAAGAYVDEGTLIPEPFFQMLLSRLSVPNAKLFLTTNPDGPYHWLKTNYIDRESELDLKTFKFHLDDNPSLTDHFKENLKQEYQGLWYQRFIEGKWVQAEGAIYDFFDKSIHVIDSCPLSASEYIVGCDYGTRNPTAFVMIGYTPNGYPNMWIEKEFYWDSKKEQRQKTDADYALDLIEFIDGYHVSGIYLDPSAASFRLELYRNGVENVLEANNDVIDGIRFVSTLLSQGTLKIHSSCTNLIKEMQEYKWDTKAAMRGIDKPLKEFDHCSDGCRYALYTRFYNEFIDSTTEEDTQRLEDLYRPRHHLRSTY